MDPPLVNICIFGVMFILFASIVDSTDQWQQQQPLLPQPVQPNPTPPPPPNPPALFKPAPPPKPSKSKPKQPFPPIAPAPAPSWQAPSPNGRPFVSAPPPIQPEQAYPNVANTDAIRNDLGRKIGCIFAGVAIIMQVLVVIFLIIKQRQLFNPDHVY